MKDYIIVIIIGYLFGCLQWSYILNKTFFKVDIRTLGTGNAGASNTVISLGWKWGVLVALLDILKAIISIFIIRQIFGTDNLSLLYVNGLSVILGHDFPFFMGFKGGKGAASLLGMLIAIDYRLGIIAFLAIFLTTIFTDYIALGTLMLNVVLFISAIYFKVDLFAFIFTFIVVIIGFYVHIPNLKSIINKKEKGLREAFNKKSKNI